MREDLVPYARAIAREVLGRADRDVTDGKHLHFGAIRLNLEKATYYDDATDVGGDLYDLVRRRKKLQNGAAETLIEEICVAEDARKEAHKDINRELPPSNDLFDLETEREIIGGLIIHPHEWPTIGEIVGREHFTFWVHQQVIDHAEEASGREKTLSIKALVERCGGDDGGDLVPHFTLTEYLARVAADCSDRFEEEAAGLAQRLHAVTIARNRADEDFVSQSEREDAREAARFKLRAFEEVPLRTQNNYLVRGLLPRSGMIVLWGPPKCGKSFWAYDIAMHVALGIEYRGRKVVQGPVVYLVLEGEAGYGARVAAFKEKNMKDHAGPVPMYDVVTRIDLGKEHDQLRKDISAQLGDAAPVLIVIDTLNRSLWGSENSDEDMGAYVKAVDALREAFNCAILIVHHCGAMGERPRGHTSLTGAADAQLACRRDAQRNVVVKVEYLKDGEEGQTLTSRLQSVVVAYEADGAPISSCVVVPLDGFQDTKRTYNPSDQEKLFMQCIMEALAEHGEPVEASGLALPRSIGKVVQYRYVAALMYERQITEHMDDEKRHRQTVRKAISRCGEKLKKVYAIGSHRQGEDKSWLWWTGKPVSGVESTMPKTLPSDQGDIEFTQ